MNQASKVHALSGLTQLGFRFIFGSWSIWEPALQLARVNLVLTLLLWLWSNTDDRYAGLAGSIDHFPPRKCPEHSRVFSMGWIPFRVSFVTIFGSRPSLWESDNCMLCRLFLLFEQFGAHSLLPIWPKEKKFQERQIRWSTAVNKLPVRLQLAPQHEKDYGTCGNGELSWKRKDNNSNKVLTCSCKIRIFLKFYWLHQTKLEIWLVVLFYSPILIGWEKGAI